ncbi:hypothetical protein EYF80_020514 [Liparis tanakae]|uniref:Uncharacterized protein n=1 Tax=Liparis tanakae TaxID=230148 RepID=A0A4Z2HU43_9TELE|nr:hypothetical protein EYF80_020514 [Liparis tanakae]
MDVQASQTEATQMLSDPSLLTGYPKITIQGQGVTDVAGEHRMDVWQRQRDIILPEKDDR